VVTAHIDDSPRLDCHVSVYMLTVNTYTVGVTREEVESGKKEQKNTTKH